MDTGAIHCGSPIKTHQFILKQTQLKTRRDKLEKGMAFLHGETKALSVKHPSIPYTTHIQSVALWLYLHTVECALTSVFYLSFYLSDTPLPLTFR